jgi:hypothetical protein
MKTFQMKHRFVKADQLTREAAEAYLWNGVPLPDGIRLASANHHPGSRTISQFWARTEEGLKVEIGDWFVEYPDGSMEVFNDSQFHSQFEAAA